jgi:hypothetical protein
MPVKRRTPKHKPVYPDAVERLIAGEAIEQTEDNRQMMIRVTYFGDWPDLPPEVRQAAFDQLTAWREAASCQ